MLGNPWVGVHRSYLGRIEVSILPTSMGISIYSERPREQGTLPESRVATPCRVCVCGGDVAERGVVAAGDGGVGGGGHLVLADAADLALHELQVLLAHLAARCMGVCIQGDPIDVLLTGAWIQTGVFEWIQYTQVLLAHLAALIRQGRSKEERRQTKASEAEWNKGAMAGYG